MFLWTVGWKLLNLSQWGHWCQVFIIDGVKCKHPHGFRVDLYNQPSNLLLFIFLIRINPKIFFDVLCCIDWSCLTARKLEIQVMITCNVEATMQHKQCLVSSLRTSTCSMKMIPFLFVIGRAINLNKYFLGMEKATRGWNWNCFSCKEPLGHVKDFLSWTGEKNQLANIAVPLQVPYIKDI